MTGVSTGECLFVCVVGPGFDSPSPTFGRRSCEAAGTDGRLAPKTESGPYLRGQGLYRHNLCRCLQHSNFVQAVSFWNCMACLSSMSCKSEIFSCMIFENLKLRLSKFDI